jgi:hypothetical protein
MCTNVHACVLPFTAGAHVYGVRPTDRRRQKAGRSGTGRRLLRAEEAAVFLPDRVPAYITWDRYQRIQAQLQSPGCVDVQPRTL